jgi:beta-fructofuranosidase
VTFELADHWVWDLWIADDGTDFHMFYLHAPKSLGNPHLRHRNARIGHAISRDLSRWIDRGPVLSPGAEGGFDSTATWTGSVIKGPDGLWRMFYTGARFLPDGRNIESIGMATSADLDVWTKVDGPILEADSRWYELLGDSSWPELAWRDPWVFEDPDGEGWHMLLTARSKTGAVDERGVVGHAVSMDLVTWLAQPPLSEPGSGFTHLEVLQTVETGEHRMLVFSCGAEKLSDEHRALTATGGVWIVGARSLTGPFEIASARLLSDEVYAGRVVRRRDGCLVLLGFKSIDAKGRFQGTISDPIPLSLP